MVSDKRFGWKSLGFSLTLIGILGLLSVSSLAVAMEDTHSQMAENSTEASGLPVFRGDIEESEVGPEPLALESEATVPVVEELDASEPEPPQVAVVTPDMERVSDRGVVGEVASRMAMPKVLERNVISQTPRSRKQSLLSPKETISAGYVIPKPSPSGTIVNNREFWTSPMTGETVYVDIGTSQGARVGDRYLVYEINDTMEHSFTNRDSLSHPVVNEDGEVDPELIEYDIWHEGRDKDLGYWRSESNVYDKWFGESMREMGDLVRVVGVVEIYEPGPELSKAKVTQFFAWFDVGSYLTPYPAQPPAPVVGKKPNRSISGFVVGSKNGLILNAQNDIIYIDKGSQDSVEVGDIMNVITVPFHQDIDARYSIWAEDERPLMNEVIGEIVVLSVQARSATALITKSKDSIMAGHVIESKR